MRLVLICDRYPPEARSVAHLFEDLAVGLAGRGHSVTVLTRASLGGRAGEDNDGRGVRVVRLDGMPGSGGSIPWRIADQVLLGLRVLATALRLERPDAIVVYSPPLLLAAVGSLFSRLTKVPLVLNVHDLYPRTAVELGVLRQPLLIALAKRVEAFAYRGARLFSIPLPGNLDYLVREMSVPRSAVRLIYNWVDTDVVSPALEGERLRRELSVADRFVVSYAGLMGYAQDLSSIIECARRLSGEPEFVFLLVGEGVHRSKWETLASGLPNVRFRSSVPRKRYYELLAASDACVIALDNRMRAPAIPGKLQNIMAAGRPTLAVVPSRQDAAKVVLEGQCGFVLAPGDADALVAAVRELRGDAALRERLGRNGRRFAEAHFSLSRALDAFEAVLRDAAGEAA